MADSHVPIKKKTQNKLYRTQPPPPDRNNSKVASILACSGESVKRLKLPVGVIELRSLIHVNILKVVHGSLILHDAGVNIVARSSVLLREVMVNSSIDDELVIKSQTLYVW